ncbi:cytochrome P450 [Actinomadura rupiterrae]|uniref:cytochrome P450 n=1 Tax=Actinomadura rupiterrae TaxID=559627 RepID=UPI0020A47A3B|nr:cytochrome P450 [Actinomadura rupiterrae]MCP2334733.1 cytochrome P450 [Actinomadura rupiterrae]
MTDQAHEPAPPSAFGSDVPAHPGHPRPVRLYGPTIADDPAELYRSLRDRYGPVVPILLDGDVPAWFVLGYREVHHVTANPQLFARDCRRWNAWDLIPDDWPLMPYVGWTPSIMFAEGAEHQRRAGAIGDALDAFDRTELGITVGQVADRLVDTFAGHGHADLIEQYSHQIPLHVVARLFGLPEADIPVLVKDVANSLDVDSDPVAAHQRIHERMVRLVGDKHREPGSDVPSRLLAHPAQLTDEEVVIDLLVVLAAAQQPTGNWIGNALRLMLVDDKFSNTMQGGRGSASHALNQVLWEDTPTQNFIGRWAVHDCQLGDQRIRRGDLLVLGLAAANRDPGVKPREYGGAVANRAHMSFGHGEHGCPFPAPELAEVMAKTAVEVLLDRLPDMELSVAPDDLEWRPSVWMRGLYTLPVKFTPTADLPIGMRN